MPLRRADLGWYSWILTCIGQSGRGLIRATDVHLLLTRANANVNGDVREYLSRARQMASPPWLFATADLLNVPQVAEMLLSLSTSQLEIEGLFSQFASSQNASGSRRMSRAAWLDFCRREQTDTTATTMTAEELEQSFAIASGRTGSELRSEPDKGLLRDELEDAALSTDRPSASPEGLNLQQFALLLLSPCNDAVGPPINSDLSQPLAHYWCATSHNSYIIGDQLTGYSSANAFRRQLLQGCRHVEVDCWDGKTNPTVTHGRDTGGIQKHPSLKFAHPQVRTP